jgi:hypothetical protein
MRLGQPRNRAEEARTFFFRLADEAGLGTFRRGVRGQPTRLELDSGAGGLLEEFLETPPSPAESTTAARVDEPRAAPVASPALRAPSSATLSITVDMSDWELEKIEAFLRLIGMLPGASDSDRSRS